MILISVLIIGLSLFAQWKLKSKFKQYSETNLQNNYSGEQIARLMLADNGIYDVRITSIEGQLTDHYNPADKTVNLSHNVYYGRNAAAAAVAAHECGHAVQHARSYSMLRFRSAMVPALSAVSRIIPFLIMGGVLALSFSILPLALGVALFAFTTLFSFVTLPVEFDASRRALAWMDTKGIVTQREHGMAKDALWWAASTYVISALGSLVTLIYYIGFLNRED
ncbi:MAG: zinc metallopeptidase [Bacteroidota bacterium]